MKDVIAFQELVFKTQPECTEANPDYWHADENDEDEKYGRSEQAIAVGICKRCPIRSECLMHAVENNLEHGVWGGTVPNQRVAFWRRQARGKKAS